jgi:hypothetical protein
MIFCIPSRKREGTEGWAPARTHAAFGDSASPPQPLPLAGGERSLDQRNLPLSDTPMIRGSLNTAAM